MREIARMDNGIGWRALTSGSATLRLINIVFILYLLVVSTNALGAELPKVQINDVGEYSHKLYEDRDEARVICGDFRVIAFSDYRVQGKPSERQSQDVTRQYFEFTDLKSGHKKMVVASTMDVFIGGIYGNLDFDSNDTFLKRKDSYLNGEASAWACLKGKDAYYLAIYYGTGGNCDNCVWIEIMNRKGVVVVRSIKDIETDNLSQYKRKLSELGLPQLFPVGMVRWAFEHDIKFKKVWLDN